MKVLFWKECNINAKEVSGIYIIKNNVNQKVYVGSSINVLQRIKHHVKLLNGNYHENSYLQHSWNKYGKEAFTFDLLEEHEKPYLQSMEQYWMNMTNCTNDKYGYNLTPTAGRNNGSKRHPSKIYYNITNAKKVYQFDLNGNYLNSYPSVREASRVTGIDKGVIQNAANPNYKPIQTAGGFLWSYTSIPILPIYKKTRKDKSVYCFNKEGLFIKKFSTIIEAGISLNVKNINRIINVCEGDKPSAYGYLWSYTEKPKLVSLKNIPKSVICFDINNNYIAKYKSIHEANRETHINRRQIKFVCEEKYKTAGGFIWKYA